MDLCYFDYFYLGFSCISLDLNLNYILFFGSILVLDLLVRWVSFGRLESIAIDISIFSLIHSFQELLSEVSSIGAYRVWGSMICLLILMGYHAYLYKRLQSTINSLFIRLNEANNDNNLKNLLSIEHVMAKWSVDVALWKGKVGKKTRREEVLDVLKKSGLDPTEILDDESLLLPNDVRSMAIFIFVLFGGLSLIIPLITIH